MIRRAENKDIDRINELLFQVQKVHSDKRPDIFKAGEKKYTTDELKEIIADDNRPIYVYVENEKILGYSFCIYQIQDETPQLHRRKTLYIDDLCVDGEARGKHIGTLLYDFIVKTAKENECDSITLNVWALNDGAKAFYEKMGLKPLKTTMENIL